MFATGQQLQYLALARAKNKKDYRKVFKQLLEILPTETTEALTLTSVR